MNTGRGSRPFKMDKDLGMKLYQYLISAAPVKLLGKHLAGSHPKSTMTRPPSFCW